MPSDHLAFDLLPVSQHTGIFSGQRPTCAGKSQMHQRVTQLYYTCRRVYRSLRQLGSVCPSPDHPAFDRLPTSLLSSSYSEHWPVQAWMHKRVPWYKPPIQHLLRVLCKTLGICNNPSGCTFKIINTFLRVFAITP